MPSGTPLTIDQQRQHWEMALVIGTLVLHVAAGAMQWMMGDLYQVSLDSAVVLAMLGVLLVYRGRRGISSRIYLAVSYLLSARTAGDLFQNFVLGIPPGPLLYVQLIGIMSLLLAFLPFKQAVALSSGLYVLVILATLKAGGENPVLLAALPLVFVVMRFSMLFSNAMVEARFREAELEVLVTRDPLTGVWSRRAMEHELRAALLNGATERQLLLMVDVDHFKQVNDSFGHAVGDVALREVARALERNVRMGDMVGRWGGEEFMVLLRQVPEDFRARSVERLVQCIRDLRLEAPVRLTVSVGVAVLTESPTLEGVMQLADQRLYMAKARGRDQAVLN